ncbi:MAG TPA: thiamine phosphate synthase [Candidatus Acidoferrales bacterium]|jgi:thiamine-phosphate pyrophosphorylase|nr:thiamine phosphate synthase [Candidatus Acidoferrales bacterium]
MNLVFPPLYAIIDAALLKTSELSFAEMMAESGVELLQYRNKRATSRELFAASQSISARLSAIARAGSYAPRFIINDRADIAVFVNAQGVHMGQEDLSVADARAVVGPDRWVGISTHTLQQLDAADKSSADYIAFGPIFATGSKENPDPVVGLEGLAEARQRTRKPLVAIGGITLERAADTFRAGADSLAVIRDLIASENPAARARLFLKEAARVRKEK